MKRVEYVTLLPLGGDEVRAKVIGEGKPGHWFGFVKVVRKTRQGKWSKQGEWWALAQVRR